MGGIELIPYQILAPDGTPNKPEDLVSLNFTQGDFTELYARLLKAHFFYKKEAALSTRKEMKLAIYGEGQHAEMGSVFAAEKMGLKPLLSYYARSHAPALIRISPKDLLLANILYNTLPETLVDTFIKERVEVPSTGVAYNITRAVGMAWALQEPVMAYFGDGATAEPEFASGINWACIWNAPVLLYCENNGIAISTPTSHQFATNTIVEKAKGIGGDKLYVEFVDGDDVFATYAATKRALEYIRGHGLPAFLETITYRRGRHTNVIDGRIIKTDEERKTHEEALARAPEIRYQKFLFSDYARGLGILWTEANDAALRDKIQNEIDDGARAALKEAADIEARGEDEIYAVEVALNSPSHAEWNATAALELEKSETLENVMAIDAFAIAMLDAQKLFPGKFKAFGQDIGRHAGVMRNWGIRTELLKKLFPEAEARELEKRAYLGYLALHELDPEAIIDATLDESGMAGVALGFALAGVRAVIEPQFSGFYMSKLHQLDEAGRFYQHYRGKLPVSLTLIMLYGSGEKIERHNEDESGDISNLLGWTVICPFSVQGYYDTILAAIISNRPTAVFVHLEHLRSLRGNLKRGIPPQMIEDLDTETVREGEDITLVTYGALVQKAVAAAAPEQIEAAYKRIEQARGEPVRRKEMSVEILALQSMSPLKAERIIESVRKTGRLLIVQEGSTNRQKLGAEAIRSITSDWRSFEFLKSPTSVLDGINIYPHAPQLEKYRTPQVENIADVMVKMVLDTQT